MTSHSTTGTVNEKERVSSSQFSLGQVTSADGTTIGYRQIGKGSGLVILHGGMRASQHYSPLAKALADTYTVYIPDRRGRGLSGPVGEDYSVTKEIEDVNALLKQTGAQLVFGHSAGGFFALEAALQLPICKLAVYEPAVSINGSLPLTWLPAFEQALARSDSVTATAIFFKGLQLNWTSKLPIWVLATLSCLMLHTDDGREMIGLLPTGLWEIKEFLRLGRLGLTYKRYQNVSAETLLLSGSQSPAYLRKVPPVLAKTMPYARWLELPRLDHNAPDQNAPKVIAAELKRFFS